MALQYLLMPEDANALYYWIKIYLPENLENFIYILIPQTWEKPKFRVVNKPLRLTLIQPYLPVKAVYLWSGHIID